MNPEILRVIADLTVELVKLRQQECRHLIVENIAPELFESLVRKFKEAV